MKHILTLSLCFLALSLSAQIDYINSTDNNQDGCVDINDLMNLLSNYGICEPNMSTDTNQDGCTDLMDLMNILSAFGLCEEIEICGNGIIESGEECDDGNNVSGDGCNGCMIECSDGYANCDGLDTNGCEVDLLNDTNNCGSCGIICSLPNAISTCVSGNCIIDSCNFGYANCDGLDTNGCEFNLDTNPSCSVDEYYLGSISGDSGTDSITISGVGEQWYKVQVREDWAFLQSPSVRFTLTPPNYTDYDLIVYKGSCSGPSQSSLNSGSATEIIQFSWMDNWSSLIDDNVTFYILVKVYSANICSSFSLNVEGNI